MSELILSEQDGDVATITINHADDGNRINDSMAVELADRIGAAAKESRLILFKGAGDEFCLGRQGMGDREPLLEALALRERFEVIFNLYDAFRRSTIPIIGIVQGRAVGLGCALAALSVQYPVSSSHIEEANPMRVSQ